MSETKKKERKGLDERRKEFHAVKELQLLSLSEKIAMTNELIDEWYDHWEGDVAVSFSGGLDSTVLLNLVRLRHPAVPAVFVDTGLEYPEIKAFVKEQPNVRIIRPKLSFRRVLEKYGAPVISKRIAQYVKEVQRTKSPHLRRLRLEGVRKDGSFSPWAKIPKRWQFLVDAPFKISDECCKILKKDPLKNGSHMYVGMRVEESQQRMSTHIHHSDRGHYWALAKKSPYTAPLFAWRSVDIWDYIDRYELPICPVYLGEDAVRSTGCMFCMFGVHLEGRCGGENRFQLMKRTHPKQYDYCVNKLNLAEILDFLGVPY